LKLRINGNDRDVPDGLNIVALLEHLDLPADRIAIELDKEIAKRSEWERIILKDGDVLEIVSFVGGG
jgi:thiamine biosynthesis protein ThiS